MDIELSWALLVTMRSFWRRERTSSLASILHVLISPFFAICLMVSLTLASSVSMPRFWRFKAGCWALISWRHLRTCHIEGKGEKKDEQYEKESMKTVGEWIPLMYDN